MAKVEIYTTEVCPYCVKAKKLLDHKGQSYEEIRIDLDESKRDIMLDRANGARTVPQIFINDHHIGGCDDMYALEAEGKLDAYFD